MDEALLASTARRPKMNAATRAVSITAALVLAFYVSVWCVRFVMVDMSLVFVHDPDMPFANVPYYVRSPHLITEASVSRYSFMWFVYASDTLDLVPVFYIPLAFLVGLTCGYRSIGNTGVLIAVIFVMLLQLAKLVYYIYILVAACDSNGFCINRDNAALASTPDFTFYVQLVGTALLFLIGIYFATLPAQYRAADRAKTIDRRIGGKLKKSDDADALHTRRVR